jgi:ABC-type polysaccharide/polyol phosphate transport system ATPase subunit
MPIIEAHHLAKSFPLRRGGRVLLGRGGIADWLRGGEKESFYAVKDVSLSFEAGESVGIIGGNGSGKSTLLKMLAGVTLPTAGEVVVRGRVASLLELGAGFHPVLTGRENVYLNAGLYGRNHAQVDAVLEDIIDFSGIREFIDQPVDTYSSGMYVRIAFAAAVHMDPDIFLVDEVLSVGDEAFQRKCRQKIGELREQGKTILFVSHDLGIVNIVCQRVLLMSQGKLLERRTPQETFDFYLRQIGQADGIHALQSGTAEAVFSHGKLALYHHEKEITAPQGVLLEVQSMGQMHAGPMADWRVSDETETTFSAEGRFARLPAALDATGRLNGNTLELSLALRALRPFDLEDIRISVALPAALDQWVFGERPHAAANITPEHAMREAETMPDSHARRVAAWSTDGTLPGIAIEFDPAQSHSFVQLVNGEYLSNARFLCFTAPMPGGRRALAEGERIDFGTLVFDLALDAEQQREVAARQRVAARLACGPFEARFDQGALMLDYAGRIAEARCLIQADALWTQSTGLAWSVPENDDGVMRIRGIDRRMNFAQYWTVQPDGNRLRWTVEIESSAWFSLREYNASLLLDPAYATWAAEHETGRFGEFAAPQEWRPLNASHASSEWIRAAAPGLPGIVMAQVASEAPLIPSALNTGEAQRRRVLQLLRRGPQGAPIAFPAGRHRLFSVMLRVLDATE